MKLILDGILFWNYVWWFGQKYYFLCKISGDDVISWSIIGGINFCDYICKVSQLPKDLLIKLGEELK